MNLGSGVHLDSAPLQMCTAVKVWSCRSVAGEAALDTRNPKTLRNPKSSSTSTNERATTGSSPAEVCRLNNRFFTFLQVIKFFLHVNMKLVPSSNARLFFSLTRLIHFEYICSVNFVTAVLITQVSFEFSCFFFYSTEFTVVQERLDSFH